MDERTQKLIDTYKAQGPLTTGQIGDVINSTPSNTAITASSLQNTKPLSIPQAPINTTADGISGASSAIMDATKNLQTLQQAEDNRLAEAQSKTGESKSALQSLMSRITGTQQSRSELEQNAGIEKKTLSYNTALTNLEASQRAQEKELRALDSANMTDAGRAVAQRDINRKYAFEQADLSLVLSVANRDLVSAQNMVDRKIQLALEPLKTQLDFTKMFYEDNKADLTKAEERAFGLKTKELERQYEEQKTLQETIGKLQLQAASQGADPTVVQAIGKAKSVGEAATAAGQYSGDILERRLKLKQLDNIQSQIDERNLTGTGADPYSIMAYAQQYASNGNIPTGIPKGSFGMISQVAKELPKPAGTIVDINTGIKSSGLSDKQTDGINALYDITQKVAQLKQLEAEIVPGFIGGVTGKVFGSDDQRRYLDLRQEIVDLLARARTGAALTAQEEKFYTDQLPGRFSNTFFMGTEGGSRIDNFDAKIQGTLQSKLSNFGASIYGYSKVKTPIGDFTVGDVISQNGVTGRVNPDGTITILNQ